MAQLSECFSKKVRDCLLRQFSEGEVSRHATADIMHMTERTLLRRLKDEGTTFQEVLDRLREELAYEYLGRTETTVQTVSSMLGFSDASTFSRAFKRWTGRRPSLAQERQKSLGVGAMSREKR
ncbi:HTH-type transcriptional regulator VirS [compost metagenome]